MQSCAQKIRHENCCRFLKDAMDGNGEDIKVSGTGLDMTVDEVTAAVSGDSLAEAEDDLSLRVKFEPTSSPETDLTEEQWKTEVDGDTACRLTVSSEAFHCWRDIAVQWCLKSDTDVAWFLIRHFEGTASPSKPTSYCVVCSSPLTFCCTKCDTLNSRVPVSVVHTSRSASEQDTDQDIARDESWILSVADAASPEEKGLSKETSSVVEITNNSSNLRPQLSLHHDVVSKPHHADSCKLSVSHSSASTQSPIVMYSLTSSQSSVSIQTSAGDQSTAKSISKCEPSVAGHAPVNIQPGVSMQDSHLGLSTSGQFSSLSAPSSATNLASTPIIPAVSGMSSTSCLVSRPMQPTNIIPSGSCLPSAQVSVSIQQAVSGQSATSHQSFSTQTHDLIPSSMQPAERVRSKSSRLSPTAVQPVTCHMASVSDQSVRTESLSSAEQMKTLASSQEEGGSMNTSPTCETQPDFLPATSQPTTTITSCSDKSEPAKSGGKKNVARKHVCGRCGASFKRRYVCIQHMQRHLAKKMKGEKPFPCTHCSARYRFPRALKKHILTHTGERRFTCELCFKSFSCRSGLKEHMRSHSDEKPYVCEECGRAYKTQTALNGHMELHDKKQCICDICGAIFPRQYYLRRHIARHKGEKPYVCQTCGASFTALNSLKVHMRYHTGERPYVCKQCDAAFAQSTDLNKHVKRMHGEDKPYECKFCGLKYALNSDLNKHLAYHARSDSSTHMLPDADMHANLATVMQARAGAVRRKRSNLATHGQSDSSGTRLPESGSKRFFCERCGSSFTLARSLRIHMRSHTGDKPHVCTECGASFATSGRLKDHMRSHTGEKPYMCDQCGSSYSSSSSLRHHQQRHTGERPFTCDECGKAFKLNKDLQRHARTHMSAGEHAQDGGLQAGLKKYVCDECGKGFLHASSLKKHKRVHLKALSDKTQQLISSAVTDFTHCPPLTQNCSL